MMIDLEMIPSRPREGCAGDVIVYNDAPAWEPYWAGRLPEFITQQLPDLSTRVWQVSLPRHPGEATVHSRE
jgi:hypothetical protein